MRQEWGHRELNYTTAISKSGHPVQFPYNAYYLLLLCELVKQRWGRYKELNYNIAIPALSRLVQFLYTAYCLLLLCE